MATGLALVVLRDGAPLIDAPWSDIIRVAGLGLIGSCIMETARLNETHWSR